jgi:hypothetical protein
LDVLVWVLTHVVPHSVCPLEQTQAPPEQLWPDAHTLPHVPQFAESVCVLTQALLQRVPLEHPHAPFEQS